MSMSIYILSLHVMSKILGISAFYHDSAAAIIVDGEIMAAAQEERFTREKHCADFPAKAISWCLEFTEIDFRDLDAVVFYDKPFLKFERLLETSFQRVPIGFVSFLNAIPVWLNKKLFMKSVIRKELRKLGMPKDVKPKLLFTEHHLSHAASAFYPSSFEESAILTIDGVGEWATATIGYGKGKRIEILKEMHFPHSVGLLYSAFTYFLGFRVNSGEYKLMGLAPYGDGNSEQTAEFKEKILERLLHIYEDGSIWLNQHYFSYTTCMRMIPDGKWESLFGFPRRKEEDPIERHHCNLALVIQEITEMIVLRMAREARRLTGSDNLCLAGGVALNCVANGKLEREGTFRDIWIQPAAGDAGGSIGAALAAHHMYFDKERNLQAQPDGMHSTYLGPGFSNEAINEMNVSYGADCEELVDDEMIKRVAEYLAEGAVVGWFQGRMEFGPRALGNRSILASPSSTIMQVVLNSKIKKRENFRPFAPVVMEEDASEYFNGIDRSPYMLKVFSVVDKFRKELPKDYSEKGMKDKLETPRSEFQAITHVDHSARVQTVNREQNPKLYTLLSEVKKITGTGMLVNTSFNVRGEPIVCTPEDAFRCFMQTGMDYLLIHNYIYNKRNQGDVQLENPDSFPED